MDVKMENSKAGKMAQSVKGLLGNYKNLSLILSTHVACTYNPNTREKETDLWGSLDSHSSQSVREPVPKYKEASNRGRHQCQPLASRNSWACMNTLMHMYAPHTDGQILSEPHGYAQFRSWYLDTFQCHSQSYVRHLQIFQSATLEERLVGGLGRAKWFPLVRNLSSPFFLWDPANGVWKTLEIKTRGKSIGVFLLWQTTDKMK